MYDPVKHYWAKIGERILGPACVSLLGIVLMWLFTEVLDPFSRHNMPSVSGTAMLAGFGILATLVVAVQVLARTIKPQDKHNNPDAVDVLDGLCRLILLSDTGLTSLVLVQWVTKDTLSHGFLEVLAAIIFGFLIAMIAGDALNMHGWMMKTGGTRLRPRDRLCWLSPANLRHGNSVALSGCFSGQAYHLSVQQ
jgi:hypothetical protein